MIPTQNKLRFNHRATSRVLVALTVFLLLIPTFILVNDLSVPLAKADLPSYTISKSGSNYLVSDSGTTYATANLAFTHAFGLVTSGGTITVQAATYTATGSSIKMEHCANIALIFEDNAILTIANSLNVPVLAVNYCSNVTITGIDINGNAAGQTTAASLPDGIVVYASNNVLITKAYITNCFRDGFASYLENAGEQPVGITSSLITKCGWNGITLSANGSYAINNEVAYCSDVGITTYFYGYQILNNYVHDMNGTTNTQAHWAISVEGNGYGIIKNNTIVNNGYGIVVETDTGSGVAAAQSNLIINNTITNCDSGIGSMGAGYDTIIQNTITGWSTGYSFGIAEYYGTNNIVAFNTLSSSSTDASLGTPIYSYNTTAGIIENNTVTTALAASVIGVYLQLTNTTLIAGNNIQAAYGISISGASNYNNRIASSNTLANCSTAYVNTGTSTLIEAGSSSSTTTIFYDNFNAGNYNLWTGTTSYNGGPWIVETPLYNGSGHAAKLKYSYDSAAKTFATTASVLNYSFAVRWSANLASGESLWLTTLDFSGGDPIAVELRNNGGTMEWGLQWTNGATTYTNWTSTGSPTANNWYDMRLYFEKGASVQLYANGTQLFSKTDVQGAWDCTGLTLFNLDSATTYPDVFYGYAYAYVSSGSAGVSFPDSWLNINKHSVHGSISPSAGRYNYTLNSNQTITLTPSTYYNAVLNVGGSNVTLTANQYVLNVSSNPFAYAVFDQSTTSYSVTFANDGHGSTYPSGSYSTTEGTVFNITASANAGYTFLNWVISGVGNFTANPLPLTMNSTLNGKTVTAYFKANTYTLTASITTPTNATQYTNVVSYSVSTSGNDTNPSFQINLYKAGVPVGANRTGSAGSFTSLATGSYMFAVYAHGDNGASDYKTVYLTVSAYSVTVTNGGHGSTNPSGLYSNFDGESLSATATASSGYSFLNWVISDVGNSSVNPLPLTMNSTLDGKTITAYFSQNSYTLSVSIVTPVAATYSSGTVSYQVTVSGTDTNPVYQINAYKNSVAVGSNLTSASGSFSALSNGNYMFAVHVQGDFGCTDYKTLNFSVQTGGGGGGGGGSNPTPTPQPTTYPTYTPTPGPSSVKTFEVDNLNLGTVKPNTTLTGTLHFEFSGSSYTLISITVTDPVRSWMPNPSITPYQVYTLNNGASGSGDYVLTFMVPADAELQTYNSEVTATALDGFGVTHTSTASLNVKVSESESSGIVSWVINYFSSNPIMIVVAVVVFCGVIAVLMMMKRR